MPSNSAPLLFLFQSMLCQAIGFAVGILARTVLLDANLDPKIIVILFALIHSLAAFGMAHFLKLPRSWKIANLLIVPAVISYVELGLPQGFLTLAVILALLLYLPTFWTRVPYYPTSWPMYQAVLAELPVNKSFVFIDLGCGFGGLLNFIAKNRPQSQIVGTELSPLAWIISWLRTFPYRKQIKIKFQDLWRVDLSKFDFVYAFLAPPPMPALWDKCLHELKPSALLLVNSFPVPAQAERQIEVNDRRGTRLYIYRVGKRAGR